AAMRASLVCPRTGRTVCTIDSGGSVVIGRQPQFDIRDAACSRQQARLDLQQTDSGSSGVESLTVTCVGAGRLYVNSNSEDKGGDQRQLLTMGESARLANGDALILGNDCLLKVSLAPEDSEPVVKKRRLEQLNAGEGAQQDSDENPSQVDLQLDLMRQAAARFSSQSDCAASASQLEASNSASQSNSSDSPSQLKPTPTGWRDFGAVLVYTTPGCLPSRKIAGFDMDGTLITTQSGRVFAKDLADWKVIYPQVPGRLKSLVAEGYKVALFSNQKGVEVGKVRVEDLKVKIERVSARLGAPMQVFLSVRGQRYRKPCTGMWHLLERDEFNAGLRPDPAESFYVGDAAGRPAETGKGRSGRKADFSCSDRLFALNCRLSAFHTPEEFFLGHRPVPLSQCRMPEFDPTALLNAKNGHADCWPTDELRQFLLDDSSCSKSAALLVLLVGYPASGKSTLCAQISRLLAGQGAAGPAVCVVNRDRLGTWQKCVQSAETALKSASGRAIVLVDNTSVDKESRQRYIECARRCKAGAACLVMQCSLAQCLHNERYRRIVEEEAADNPADGPPSKKRREPVSEMVFNQMRAKFVEPSLSEGFDRILKVPFVPSFQVDEHRRLYCQYLVEK
ncbi:hypothetical protein BOX15_Mlig031906g2, partial [Macrostomum lignano]